MQKKKMKMILIAVLAVAVCFAVIAAAARHSAKSNLLDGPDMERKPHDYLNVCSYSRGGGMDGGYESVELRQQPDGTVLFSYSCCPYVGAAEETVEKTFPDRSVFDPLAEICERTGVLTWGELEDSDLLLLDAPTASIAFTFFDTEYYAVSDGKTLPESGTGLFSDIYNYLISLQ